MSSVKVHIRVGEVEIDYEGDAGYLKDGLPSLLNEMLSAKPVTAGHRSAGHRESPARQTGDTDDPHLNTMTPASICKKLDAKSGPEVVLAAAASLQLAQGQETFTRQELLDATKKATGYYKSSFANNLSSYLTSLTKDDSLRQAGGDKYTLSAKKSAELRGLLKE